MKIVNFFKDLFQFIRFCFRMMYKLFRLVLMITGIITVVRCSSGFTKKGDKVYYNGEEVGKDFVVLSEEFAKDDSTVYFKMKSIPDADTRTFKALSKNYGKDARTVYFCDERRDVKNLYLTKTAGVYKIQAADATSFVMLGDVYSLYAKDKNWGYFNGDPFEVKDPASLEVIQDQFLKDKFQLYCNLKPIPGSDPASFKMLQQFYFSDKNKIYTFVNTGDVVTIPCQRNSFLVIEYPYSKDSKNVFHIDKKLEDAEVTTFQILGNEYSKDKMNAYFRDQKIEGVDVASFVIDPAYENTTEECYYAKDKVQVYYKDLVFKGADVQCFQAIKFGYTKDKNHIYYDQKIVRNADPGTFEVYDHMVGDADAADKNGRFGKGVKLTVSE